VFLRGEVVEDGFLGDTCLARDLADGNVIEAACHEEAHPGGRDRLPRLELLRLPQAHSPDSSVYYSCGKVTASIRLAARTQRKEKHAGSSRPRRSSSSVEGDRRLDRPYAVRRIRRRPGSQALVPELLDSGQVGLRGEPTHAEDIQ